MATHNFYLTDTAATSPGWYGLLGDGTAPASVNCVARITTGAIAVGSFIKAQGAGAAAAATTSATVSATSLIDSSTGPVAGSGSAAGTLGDCWITPATLTGTFTSGTWTINCGTRAQTGGNQCRFRMRIWRSVNASGASPTEITSGALVGTTGGVCSTTVSATSTITWSAPSFTVTNEYLFFQPEFQEQTTAGAGSTTKINNRTGTETTIATTDLGSGAPFIFPRSKLYKRR